MYVFSVVLLLIALPLISAGLDTAFWHHGMNFWWLAGRWLVFWGAGVRLFLAGVRQVLQPGFTAQAIFRLTDTTAFPIVRELGFANLSMGALGICTLFRPSWILPAAFVGGLYYGLAGAGHILVKERNLKEVVAMITDAYAFVALMAFVALNWR
jgi:hypothetical protein